MKAKQMHLVLTNLYFFISHMVQMKVVLSILLEILRMSFISHMVQMKEEKECQYQ